jgi:hypothetical protein
MFHFRPLFPNAINPEKRMNGMKMTARLLFFRLPTSLKEGQAAGPAHLRR